MKQIQLLLLTFLFLFLGCSEENSPITMISLYQITPIQSPKPVGAHCVRPWMHGRVSDVKIIISLKQKCKKLIHKTAPA